eukprot:COSAG02_NODE_3413_length_6785_cov_8.990278_1_plen_86_part_10
MSAGPAAATAGPATAAATTTGPPAAATAAAGAVLRVVRWSRGARLHARVRMHFCRAWEPRGFFGKAEFMTRGFLSHGHDSIPGLRL